MTYKGDSVILKVNFYENNDRIRLAIIDDVTGEPIAVITTNITEVEGLCYNEACIKNYFENEGILQWMKDNNLIEEVLGMYEHGFITVPIVRLNINEIKLVSGWIWNSNIL
jgi:hypothetical protein